MARRKYEQSKRAERHEETRHRIITAAMELHGTVGPLATTVSAVAERAGVERLTVYRHFPTTRELFEGCGALFMQTYPLPALTTDPAPSEADRIQFTLGALYRYYGDRQTYLSVFLRDAEQIPDLRAIVDLFVFSEIRRAQAWLVAAFEDPPKPALLAAVLGQALDFWGWRSWTQQGLTNDQVIELVVSIATHCAGASPADP